jgi:glycine/sarcosine/betaine reductase complex component A
LKERKIKMLKDKKVIAIGDRDGIPGPAIQAVCESAGAEVVFASTECFV